MLRRRVAMPQGRINIPTYGWVHRLVHCSIMWTERDLRRCWIQWFAATQYILLLPVSQNETAHLRGNCENQVESSQNRYLLDAREWEGR